MKKILGLDLGTNSIGWALINQDFSEHNGNIIGMGSRIIPMDQGTLGEFERGNTVSQTKERTSFRGVRRLRERHLLRRARLHVVLKILGFLPNHYENEIDFNKHYGQFFPGSEPKLVYKPVGSNQKPEFLFTNSFNEMMSEFANRHPLLTSNGLKIPYDWTIYYLRKKALSQRIEKQELAWLLLNFNQKRGYFQLRGEDDDEQINKLVQFHSLRVIDVIDSGDHKGKDEVWYNVILENGWIYRRNSRTKLDWVGKVKEFVVTTDLNDDGSVKTDKDGKEKRSFRAPGSDDWTLVKKKTEFEIEQSRNTVGTFIYESLLNDPSQKINGKLVSTIERNFYKIELKQILEQQSKYHPELMDKQLLEKCADQLYKNNENHSSNLKGKDFTNLFLNDIIFYQRPLKSKKFLIGNCRYESRQYRNNSGLVVSEPIKGIAKSHPLFQEFRLWQFLHNLRIYRKNAEVDGKIHAELDVTHELIKTEDDWVELFDWLNKKKEIKQESFLKYPPFQFRKSIGGYRWNYVEDKIYPANETRANFLLKFDKLKDVPKDFLTREVEESLWHILYSVEDKSEIEKALNTFALKNNLSFEFVDSFKKFPPFKKEYGAYSSKAIKKLLPLMRKGKYWNENDIQNGVKERINDILLRLDAISRNREKIADITDDEIPKQVLKSFIDCDNPLKGLNTYQACYAVYGRHSEEGEILRWKDPSDVDRFLKFDFKQHGLRNPIVEQIISETLRVVRDIWSHFGKGMPDYFNEIHVEMGRDMKNTADQRKKMTTQISANENTNLRIKALLAELSMDPVFENARQYSPAQQDILKIFEDGVLSSGIELPEDIQKISKNGQPTKTELIRYKLWLEQKYRSPYTGEVIPLSKLFTHAYEIEHIIPQSRYFDDSISNKVICESEINKDKDNSMGFEYIKENSGKIVALSLGRSVKLFTVDAYVDFVKNQYSGNRGKLNRLLMDEIPDGFIARQLNDTRYISKVVKNLLSNIVREEGEDATTSKNLATSNGTITTILKKDWGLHDVWNEIITPRFERLNVITQSNQFGEWINRDGKRYFSCRVPSELQKGFEKKRIDHRHHAMDALVIACATRNHINYLNNEYAKSDFRYDLRTALCFKDKTDGAGNYKWTFFKPWTDFTSDAKKMLETVVVSFKQNIRLINKTVNHYQKWDTNDEGKMVKVVVKQEKGDHWAVRKPMHKDTVAGEVTLQLKKQVTLSAAIDQWTLIVDIQVKRKIKSLVFQGQDKKSILSFFKSCNNNFNGQDVTRLDIYYIDKSNVATRVAVDESFTSKVIEKITDTGIQKIMINHLANYNELKGDQIVEHPELAFCQDGLDLMNANLSALNAGKAHKPIFKVRCFEPKGNKFSVGFTGNKKSKFVEAAKGTNLFYAIYVDKEGNRSYESIPLNVVVERLKQKLSAVPEVNVVGNKLLFSLAPNDLVFLPTIEERQNQMEIDYYSLTPEQINRVYKIVSFSGVRLYGIPYSTSISVADKIEYSLLNKLEFTPEKFAIKEICIKLELDRLGNIANFYS